MARLLLHSRGVSPHLLGMMLFTSLLCLQTHAEPVAKVLPDPARVYAGYYNIGDLAVGYGEITAKSGDNAPPIVFTFHDWNSAGVEAEVPVLQDFHDPLENEVLSPLQLAERVAQDGGVLAIAWDAVGYFYEHPDYFTGGGIQSVSWDDIFAGQYDPYIRNVAQQIKAFGEPIMLSPAGEFNSIGFFSFGEDGKQYYTTIDNPADAYNKYGDPTVPDGPERVRDLYRYVIDIFREEEVRNVTWFMYSHTDYMNPRAIEPEEFQSWEPFHPRHYYPGDDYIDWVGTSAYLSIDDPNRDLENAVKYGIDTFREITNKPFFIPEFGITSEAADNRADRIRTLFLEEMHEFPEIRAFAMADGELWAQFFDIPRLGHHPEELPAWQEAVWESGDYTRDLNISRVPEPITEALVISLIGVACLTRPWLLSF